MPASVRVLAGPFEHGDEEAVGPGPERRHLKAEGAVPDGGGEARRARDGGDGGIGGQRGEIRAGGEEGGDLVPFSSGSIEQVT